jgi:hypothetical protein
LSNGCPISTPGRVWIPICAGSGSAPSFLVFDASLSPTSRLSRSTRQTIPISGAVTLGAPLVRPARGGLSLPVERRRHMGESAAHTKEAASSAASFLKTPRGSIA